MECEGEITDKIEKGKMGAMEKREKLVHNKCGRDSWSSPQDDVETRGGSIIGLRQAKSPVNLTNMVLKQLQWHYI